MSASLASSSFVYKRAQGPSYNDVSEQKMLHKYVTKEEKANFLAQETGMELILAEEFLASNGWNLSEAMKGYRGLVELENKKKSANKPSPTTTTGNKSMKKIGRGFSMSNMSLVQQAREKLIVEQKEVDEGTLEDKLAVTAKRSFVLPDISQFGKVLAAFIKEDLISATAMSSLTAKGRLNWWADIGACRKLFPLSTIGDGNCLLHAASLGMWGFHDRMLRLRKALHLMLQSPNAKKSIKRRWKYNLWKENMKNGNLMYSRDEWDEEWEEVVKLASERPHHFDTGRKPRRMSRTCTVHRNTGDMLQEGESLDSLEAIHVYVLSNLIRRPIIVISEDMLKDSSGRDVAPIPFGGIYLPLEREAETCWKYPLVLSYDASHFSALVPIEGDATHNGERLSTSVPLMDSTLTLLPIRFLIDPGSTWDLVQDDSVKEERTEHTYEEHLAMLRSYLDAVKVTFNNGVAPKNNLNKIMTHVHEMFVGQNLNVLIAARLNMKERPDNYTEMIENYVSNARQRLQKLKISKTKCLSASCNMFSSPEFNGYCLVCHEKRIYTPRIASGCNNPPIIRSSSNNTIETHSSESRTKVPQLTLRGQSVPSSPNRTNMYNQVVQPTPSPPLYENTVDLTDGTSSHSIAPERTDLSSSVSSSVPNAIHCYQNVGIRCQSPGCKFYGSLETKGYCSSCYRKTFRTI